jgi:hypothetical protein
MEQQRPREDRERPAGIPGIDGDEDDGFLAGASELLQVGREAIASSLSTDSEQFLQDMRQAGGQ